MTIEIRIAASSQTRDWPGNCRANFVSKCSIGPMQIRIACRAWLIASQARGVAHADKRGNASGIVVGKRILLPIFVVSLVRL